MKRSREHGFTLVEVLATLAILGILFAILIPVSSNIRASARATSCLSNLRETGIALQLYLLENDDTFPMMAAARGNRDQPEPAVDTILAPYLGDPEVLLCPSDNRNLFEDTGSSYYWNSALNGQRLGSLNFLTVTDLTRIPVLADKESFHKPGANPVQFLYADGHVDKTVQFFTD